MNKINYIAPKKVWKSLAKTAIILSTTLLASCDNEKIEKESIVATVFEDSKVYNKEGEMSFLSHLYYVENIDTEEAHICRKEFLNKEVKIETKMVTRKYTIPLGRTGLITTTNTYYYYLYIDLDTKLPIAIVEEESHISVDNEHRIDHLQNKMVEKLLEVISLDYTKEQLKEEMKHYQRNFTTEELKFILNMDGKQK